jgi:hypothetical protein
MAAKQGATETGAGDVPHSSLVLPPCQKFGKQKERKIKDQFLTFCPDF